MIEDQINEMRHMPKGLICFETCRTYLFAVLVDHVDSTHYKAFSSKVAINFLSVNPLHVLAYLSKNDFS